MNIIKNEKAKDLQNEELNENENENKNDINDKILPDKMPKLEKEEKEKKIIGETEEEEQIKFNEMLAKYFYDNNGIIRKNTPTEDEINELKDYYNLLIVKRGISVADVAVYQINLLNFVFARKIYTTQQKKMQKIDQLKLILI